MAEESEDDQDKTEEATPQRLDKAREEGQVARSRELTTFMLLGAGLAGMWMSGPFLYQGVGGAMEAAFRFDRNQLFDTNVMLQHIFDLGQHAMIGMLPFLLVMFLVALVSPLLLGGWLLSAKSLQPKLSKLNPIKGMKRLFSSQVVIELLKAMAKALLVGAVSMTFLFYNKGVLLSLMNLAPDVALGLTAKYTFYVCGLMILSLLVAVLIDVPYQLWSHAKKLRMTKEEIKREHKETEGDPHQKGHIRSMQQRMARSRMMSQVPEADVIVTNPTHFSVALRYDESHMQAPRVIAKGAGSVALRIRELGGEYDIPLLEAPPLARALHRYVDLEHEVPGPLYGAVAEVLAWAMGLKRSREDGGLGPTKPTNLFVPEHMADENHVRSPA